MLTTLPALFANPVVGGINDAGQIAGTSAQGQAVLISNGAVTNLGVLPGDTTSTATGINSAGVVVGYSQFTNYIPPPNIGYDSHGFVTQGTKLVALTGASDIRPCGINARGQIAATNEDNATSHAMLFTNNVAHALPTPDGMYSVANALNSFGQVVGYFGQPDATTRAERAFLSTAGGALRDLGTLPADTSSRAEAVNDAGVVVGVSGKFTPGFGTVPSAYNTRAVLWQNGQVVDLTAKLPAGSDWKLTDATGINNAGQICGTGNHNGSPRAFLLSPQ